MTLKYLKLDMTSPAFPEALAECQAAFAMEHPGNTLGVNENKDKTACWVKTSTEHGLESNPALVDEATLEDVARVLAETSAESWTGAKPGQPAHLLRR